MKLIALERLVRTFVATGLLEEMYRILTFDTFDIPRQMFEHIGTY